MKLIQLKRCKNCDCFVSKQVIWDYTKTFGWRKYIQRECDCISQMILLDGNPDFHWFERWGDYVLDKLNAREGKNG